MIKKLLRIAIIAIFSFAQPFSVLSQTEQPKCCRYCGTGKACGDSCINKNDTCKKPRGCACDGQKPSPSIPPLNCKEEIILNPVREKSSSFQAECRDFLISVRFHNNKCGLTNIKTVRVKGSEIRAVGTGCTACKPPRTSFAILADGRGTGIQNVAEIVSFICATKKPPSKKACQTAIKILTDYKRLLDERGSKYSENDLKEWNEKRDNGTITIYDLPGTLHRVFPGEIKGYTLQEIRDLCK